MRFYTSNYSLINIPIEMLRDDSAGQNNARCLYVCERELTIASCQSIAHNMSLT